MFQKGRFGLTDGTVHFFKSIHLLVSNFHLLVDTSEMILVKPVNKHIS